MQPIALNSQVTPLSNQVVPPALESIPILTNGQPSKKRWGRPKGSKNESKGCGKGQGIKNEKGDAYNGNRGAVRKNVLEGGTSSRVGIQRSIGGICRGNGD